jgi:oligoribonuclease
MVSTNNKEYFLWLDCEMTGLDSATDHILEIAALLTDSTLTECAFYESVIYHEDNVLKKMNSWSQEQHKNSGLIDKVRCSEASYASVENDLVKLIKEYTLDSSLIYLAGNSVYVDRLFVAHHMPRILAFLHYRLFDVSSFKIAAGMRGLPTFEKEKKHTAKEDIRESIEEYKYYKENLFKL